MIIILINIFLKVCRVRKFSNTHLFIKNIYSKKDLILFLAELKTMTLVEENTVPYLSLILNYTNCLKKYPLQ